MIYVVSSKKCMFVVLKSPTLGEKRHEHVFISVGGSHHLTSRFCKVELGLTENSKSDHSHQNRN